MKTTIQEIEFYIEMLFMTNDLDFNGYLELMRHKEKCIEQGKIIFLI